VLLMQSLLTMATHHLSLASTGSAAGVLCKVYLIRLAEHTCVTLCSSSPIELNPDGTKRRKKRNRWGDANENKAAGLMGLPTAIMANMTAEQLEAYTLHLRIEEISQKLRINDVVPADGDRYDFSSMLSWLNPL
jgi:hypothetical protein